MISIGDFSRKFQVCAHSFELLDNYVRKNFTEQELSDMKQLIEIVKLSKTQNSGIWNDPHAVLSIAALSPCIEHVDISISLFEKQLRNTIRDLKTSELSTIKTFLGQKDEIRQLTRDGQACQDNFTRHVPRNLNNVTESSMSKEILLNASLYSVKGRELVKTHEFVVLSSNYLSDIKDTIYCTSDLIYEEESSAVPEQHGNSTHSSVIKSLKNGAFFYINNTFYNDTDTDSTDYSSNIISWIMSRSNIPQSRYYNHPQISKKSMQDTRLSDLSIMLDNPYLFTHYGDCEHLLVFTRVYSFYPGTDDSNPDSYPLVFLSRFKKKKCSLCDLYIAKHVTLYDRFAPEHPCFFCDKCYLEFHYDTNGNLLYDGFEVYRYIQHEY